MRRLRSRCGRHVGRAPRSHRREPDYGYATFEAHAEATYQFPVLYSEAWEAQEDGILGDLAIEDIERDIATATRTVRLMMMVDAYYEPGAQRLSQFELTSAELE